MRTWSTDAGDVRNDPLIAAELADWLHRQGIKETLNYDRIIGCPHEEGIDYPMGRTCPRCPLGMTQHTFAARFGFSINTLRHWEQGRREPEGPTRAYLLVINRAPRAVQRALRIA